MTTIHTGNTTTTGFSVTSDSTGNLVIKTGGSGGTTALTVDDNQIATFANQPVVPVPAFRGYLSTDQSISSSTQTKVNIDTVTGDNFFDTHGWFDTTNKRYVPQIAGYYQFNGVIRCEGTSQTFQYAAFFKSGTRYGVYGFQREVAVVNVTASDIIYLNGTTDYVELWGYITATSPRFDYDSVEVTCFFSGFLVRAA
jgi:hypothetical protein